MSLAGRVALITGGSHGLGRTVAERFVGDGARVAVCGREEKAVREAEAQLGVYGQVADVSNPADVGRLVDTTVERLGAIDILICCAGVQGPIGLAEEVEWCEWAHAVEVNLFGTVLACRSVVPLMKQRGAGKIIAISGGGATSPRPRFSAYAASKAAVVRFVETLAEELQGSGVDINAIAPGALNTRMLDAVIEAGPEKIGAATYDKAVQQRELGAGSMRAAVDLIAFLASSAGDGITGRLISAVWDEWRRLPEIRDRLRESDIYTLRRIVPEDRGMA